MLVMYPDAPDVQKKKFPRFLIASDSVCAEFSLQLPKISQNVILILKNTNHSTSVLLLAAQALKKVLSMALLTEYGLETTQEDWDGQTSFNARQTTRRANITVGRPAGPFKPTPTPHLRERI